jgi:adenosylmethionine-8-amino-7-oxononanoate aminotransferase
MKSVPSGAQLADADLAELDRTHLIHPFSALRDIEETDIPIFVEGSGVHLTTHRGEIYLDAISGLYNVAIGYGRSELARAAAEQMEKLPYASLFFELGNEPAARLAARLATIAPSGVNRFFFTLGGSDAVDTAVKLIRHRTSLQGRPEKTHIIGRREGYHGMTFGAVSATGGTAYRSGVGPLLPGFSHISQPSPDDADAAEELEAEIRARGAESVAAFIAEPISLPAGAVIPHRDYWPRVREICSKHDVLLVADEVITGFGRTGAMFALEHWGVVPDVMIMSKGITSGYAPLGAVGVTGAFYAALRASDEPLLHGFTTSGHPVACAVALRNIDVIEEERLVERAAVTGAYMLRNLQTLAGRQPGIRGVRGLGLLAAIDLESADGEAVAIGRRVADALRADRVLVRYYGSTIVVAPSLSITHDEVDDLCSRLENAVKTVVRANHVAEVVGRRA